MGSPDSEPKPHFVINEGVDDAEIIELHRLQQSIEKDPTFHKAAINILALGSKAVTEVLDFVDSHTDAKVTLRSWLDVFDKRFDNDFVFDKDTEKAASHDSTIARLLKDKKINPDERRDMLRRRRFNFFAERMQRFKKAREKITEPTEEVPPKEDLSKAS